MCFIELLLSSFAPIHKTPLFLIRKEREREKEEKRVKPSYEVVVKAKSVFLNSINVEDQH